MHKPILEISSDTLFSIKKKMDLPMSAMDCIMTEIRKDLGRGGNSNAHELCFAYIHITYIFINYSCIFC